MEILQRGILHFVNAFDLPYQQLGGADHLERLVAIGNCIFQRGDQSLILGTIVGLMAQVLAERGNFSSSFILNDNAVSGRPGIAACTAVTESDEVVLGRVVVRAEQLLSGAG